MEYWNKLSNGEKVVVVAGVVMLIASFLPWYKVEFLDVASITRNGWESPGALWSVLATLLGVVMAGAILGSKFGNVKLPDLGNYTWGQAYIAGGGLALLFIIIKLINESSSMSYGFFLGIIAAIGLAGGGYLLYMEEKGKSPVGQ